MDWRSRLAFALLLLLGAASWARSEEEDGIEDELEELLSLDDDLVRFK